MRNKRSIPSVLAVVGIGALMLLILPFGLYAWNTGLEGLTGDTPARGRFFTPDAPLSNLAIFGHMIPGAVLSVVAPFQTLAVVRTRLPRLHHINGYVVFSAAMLTGAGGLFYIALQGTIGGVWMDLGFSVYGGLLLLAAVQSVRHAQARRFSRHRRWALRLVVLAIGSWLYRVHYGLWALAGYAPQGAVTFDTRFDLIQNFAFYLPYLIALEIWFRFGASADQRAMSTQTKR